MKKVLLVPDSFKGTMSSTEVCQIMKRAIKAHYPACDIISVPVADGGEGTVDSFLSAMGGEKIQLAAEGPYMEEIKSFYGILPDGTAVIEMAAAAGLPLTGSRPKAEKTTSYGVGRLMLDAARRGCKKIILGLGGSATNDLGCGAAAAGVRFFDSNGEEFIPVGETLGKIYKIDRTAAEKNFEGVKINAMCDIDNPLFGENGAAYVFAPQKGASKDMVKFLDGQLRSASETILRRLGIDISHIPGAGAAGGMGGGMVAFFQAELQMGIEAVLDTVGFDELLRGTDLVFTGEGRIDSQSLRGKVVAGVGQRAKKQGVPVVAIVGDICGDMEEIYNMGIKGIFSINRLAVPYSEARLRAQDDLYLTMDNLMRFLSEMNFRF